MRWGPFYRLVKRVADGGGEAQFAALTGRDQGPRFRLVARMWRQPVHVLGYVDDIQTWMRAADMLVTKPVPATITAALAAGVPIVVSGGVPGQETSIVAYVTDSGAAVWAPTIEATAADVQRLLQHDREELTRMTKRAQRAGRLDTARQVAEIAWQSAIAADKSLRSKE